MVSRRKLALDLRKHSFAAARSSRRMTSSLGDQVWANSHNPQSQSSLDHTWRSSRGISFSSPEKTTWTPSQGLHFFASEPLSNAVPVQEVEKEKEPFGTIDRGPLVAVQDSLARNNQNPGLPNVESSLQNEETYPSLGSLMLDHGKDKTAVIGQIHPSQGNKIAGSPSADEPFRTPLGFHIPEKKLQAVLDAAPLSAQSYWQYKLYVGPDGENDKVKIHYCKNKEDSERVAQLFMEEEVIGFDIEWKVNAGAGDGIRKNTALVQVASERRVALFHLARYPPNATTPDDFLPPSLKTLMESPNITKVGVSVKGDSTRLKNHLKINARGLFELSHLYKLVKFSTGDVKRINRMLVSLADQVQEHLQLPLWKGEVRSSDWSRDLNHQQIQYAASDSYAGFQLYHILEAKRKALKPTPPRPAHAELNLPIKLVDGHTAVSFDERLEAIDGSCEDSESCSDMSVAELTGGLEHVAINDSVPRLDVQAPTSSAPAPISTPIASSSSEKCSIPTPSREIQLANAWIDQYNTTRATPPATAKAVAKPAELRAYALWHEQRLDVPTIANILRSPPLQTSTVANYIGKAIQWEKLPYDPERIRDLELYSGAYKVPGLNWKALRLGE